jgi:hypothetical protein
MLTDDPENRSSQRQWLNIIVAVAAIALVVSIFLLIQTIKHGIEPQNCHMAGFNNCGEINGPVITSPYRRGRLE